MGDDTARVKGYASKQDDGWHAGIEWPDGKRQCVVKGQPTIEAAHGELRKWIKKNGGQPVVKDH